MKILVTGGTGYIGSVTVRKLQKKGYEVVVFDNLINGNKKSVSCKLIIGDLLDKEFLYKKLKNENFNGVIHFAAYALAPESMMSPYKYFQNNILGGLNLLEFMKDKGIPNLVFSSSCSIYGESEGAPIKEDWNKSPESAYGESKLIFEKILAWYDKIHGIKSISLRYFNAAGASLDGILGEKHSPETHIIPLAIEAALKKTSFSLFGNNYDTPDGTCIRDYIHVEDLASVHVQALKKLFTTKKSNHFNVGSGKGHSNLEIIEMVKKITGTNFPVRIRPKRKGDPAKISADIEKAKRILKFKPKYSDLGTIIKSAYKYHKKTSGV